MYRIVYVRKEDTFFRHQQDEENVTDAYHTLDCLILLGNKVESVRCL